MTSTPCPHCASAAHPLFETIDWNRHISAEKFPYYKCSSCAVIFLSPVPRDLSLYYAAYHSVPTSLAQLEAAGRHERYKVELIQQFVPQGRLLEIGPAHGTFAHVAKQAGYDVSAIEMDPECCRFLTNVVGIRAIESADPAAALAGEGEYDVIAMWHVIEHLHDPDAVLRAAAKRLAPGGILVVAAPNPASAQFRCFGARWAHIDAPRHLTLLPIAVIESVLRIEGLETRHATTNDTGGLGWNRFGWHKSLEHLMPTAALNPLAHFAARALTFLARPVERKPLNGATYTLVFQRARRVVPDGAVG